MRDAGPVQKMSPLQTGSAFEGGTWKVRSLPNPQSSCFQNSTDSSEARPCYGRQTRVVPCSPPPRADLDKASGPLVGHASLNSSSSHSPLKNPSLTQASSTLSKRPAQMPPGAGLRLQPLLHPKPTPQHPTVLPALCLLSNPCITSPLSTELTTNFLKASGSQTVVYNWSFCSLHEAEELVPKRKSTYFFILNFQKE